MNYPGETLVTTDTWSGSVFSGREIRDWGDRHGQGWTENWDMAFLRGMVRWGC